MKKMSLAFVVFCTCILLSFTACSPGYGCSYTAVETISEQVGTTPDIMAAVSEITFSDEQICLP